MECELKETVAFADISFNSEPETLKLLNEEAGRQEKTHKVVLMIDLGDLREGIFYQNETEIFAAAELVLKLEHLELYGIAVNLTCYGAIIPKHDNLSLLCQWAEKIENKFGIRLQMISGGNSSSIYLIERGELPEKINNLRLGESFLLGNDTAYGTKLPGTTDDALILEAQIVELKEKPSLPVGEVGVDAFGQKPHYEDRGIIKRAIIAIGKMCIRDRPDGNGGTEKGRLSERKSQRNQRAGVPVYGRNRGSRRLLPGGAGRFLRGFGGIPGEKR